MSQSPQSGIRLQKFLADRGVSSRRKIEVWISEGKIRVDGGVAQLGDRVTENSRISIDGRPLRGKSEVKKRRVLLYNKPEGEICTRDDPGNRPTVFRRLPKLKGERWVVVGRLDINTRGLLLFTNDGDLANRLMHPEFGMEREYLCRVFGKVEDDALVQLKEGIELDGQLARFEEVKRQRGEGKNTWYDVVISEGKYREVRRMWEAVGCRVSRLVRIRYGKALLPKSLKQGELKELSPSDISKLLLQQVKGEVERTEVEQPADAYRKTTRPSRERVTKKTSRTKRKRASRR